MKVFICDECPCKNTDIEGGESCNLGSGILKFYNPGEGSLTISKNCELVELTTKTDTYTPDTREFSNISRIEDFDSLWNA